MLDFQVFRFVTEKTTADVHAVVINQKAGRGESKHRPGRSTTKQPGVDQKYSTDQQLYKHTM